MDWVGKLPPFPPPPLIYLHALPGTEPLTPVAAALPPLLYYVALTLLPPIPSNPYPGATSAVRNVLAASAFILFLRLPLYYHVPFSVGLTYQLALVGLYGAARILDHFLISYYWLDVIPRRVTYTHTALPPSDPHHPQNDATPADASYFSLHFLAPSAGSACQEHVKSEFGFPTALTDRLSWALELELAMRGAGFTWSSADVRHTRKTWRPSIWDRMHSIAVHVVPVLVGSWAVIRGVQVRYLADTAAGSLDEGDFDALPYAVQAALTASLGAFLMAAFSFGHSVFAILLHLIVPTHPLSYFPPLYSKRVWELKSVRDFWSYGWHRLFSRLFLVYGSWPGEYIERLLTGKSEEVPADVGKVLGAFLSSAYVHSFAGHTVVPGGWRNASGEAWFFFENGVAVIIEEAVRRLVIQARRRALAKSAATSHKDAIGDDLGRWYDDIVGRIWWITVLLYTGRNFARGWALAGLVKEMSFAST